MTNTGLKQETTLANATRARAEWTLSEIKDLEELRAAGFEATDIALYLNRSYYAISNMVYMLNTGKGATLRPSVSYSRAAAAHNLQSKPACETCWTFHPGDC